MSWNRREFLGRSLMGVGLACLPLASAGAVTAGASTVRPGFGGTAAPGMERWLLDTGRSHIEAPVYDLVASRIR
jgi:hypothetical protein